MATIINTLEVVLEPAKPGLAPPGPAAGQPPVPLAPQDLHDILEREERIAMRLFAH